MSVVLVIWFFNEEKIKIQSEKNLFLQSEIKALDSKITEISNMQKEIEKLQAHQRAVEKLQANRNHPVYLLSFLIE